MYIISDSKKYKRINEERSLEVLSNDTFKKLKKQQDHIMYAGSKIDIITQKKSCDIIRQ